MRHATHALLGRVLLGRGARVDLSPEGERQAEQLCQRFAREGLDLVQSSPQQRTIATAEAVARGARAPLQIVADLDEVDFGEWAGRSFGELADDPEWQTWNRARARARAPGGEAIDDVLARVLRHLANLGANEPEARIAWVTHAEVIRTLVLHTLGLALDDYVAVPIGPASVTVLNVRAGEAAKDASAGSGIELVSLNEPITGG